MEMAADVEKPLLSQHGVTVAIQRQQNSIEQTACFGTGAAEHSRLLSHCAEPMLLSLGSGAEKMDNGHQSILRLDRTMLRHT